MDKLRKLFKPHFPYLLVIIGVILLLTRNLWGTRAWIETHDGIFHLLRLEKMVEMLKAGAFPVRWVSSLDNDFGLPLFTYMYPGPYYLGSPLLLLGLSSKWVIKLVTIMLYFLGTLGIYTLLQKHSKFFATISAILFATTPYLLLNIIVRGALGEFMAISLVPWVLYSLMDLSSQKKLAWYHPLPYALMLISHNFLSLLFLPVLLIVSTFLYKPAWKNLAVSLLLSFSLAAFFVLPMIMGRGDLSSFNTANFTYVFRDHFVYFRQLIFSPWGYGHSYAGTKDGFSFSLGLPAWLILVLGLYYSYFKKNSSIRLWTILTVISLLLLLPISLPIWQILTPLQIIQFPWRLLSFTPIGIPLLFFELTKVLKPTNKIYYLATIITTLALVSAFIHTIPPYYQSNDQLAQQLYIHRNKTTTSSRLEILPRWVASEERYHGDEHVKLDVGDAVISNVMTSPLKLEFESIVGETGAVFKVRRNYYPGWQIKDQFGKTYPVSPTSDGELSFSSLAGSYHFVIRPASTLIDKIGNGLSLLTFLGLLYAALLPVIKKAKL